MGRRHRGVHTTTCNGGAWRMRGVLAALVLSSGLLAAPAGAQDTTLRDLYSANGLLNRGMYELAAKDYRRFLAEHADHAKVIEGRYGLAVSLYHLAQYSEAVDEVEQITQQRDFEFAAEALMILGQCRLQLEKPGEAARAFAEVHDHHAQHAQAERATALEAEALYKADQYKHVAAPAERYARRWPDGPLRERVELVWGLSEMALGRHADAARRFEAMTRSFPRGTHFAKALLLQAKSLHHAGALADADRVYRAVIKSNDTASTPDALYGLGVLLHGRGRLDDASAALDQLLDDHPSSSVIGEGRLLRGRVYFDEGDYAAAQRSLRPLAKTKGPIQDDAAYWIAKCVLREGDAEEAARRLTRAVEQFPRSNLAAEMRYDRGVALLRSGEPEEALEILDDFYGRYLTHALAADALQLIAATLHHRRDFDRSLTLCLQFAAAYPDHELLGDVRFLEAENHYLLHAHPEASQRYRRFLERYPNHAQSAQARYRLGLSLYQQERYDDAETWLAPFARGMETEPAYRSALLAVGDGRFQQRRWAEAQQHLAAFVALSAGEPMLDDALLKLALSHQRLDEFEEAARRFATLIETFPESPHRLHAIFEHGQTLVSLDRPQPAKRRFEQVLAEGPDSRFAPHAHNHLGSLASTAGSFDEAATHFAAASNPEAGVLDEEAIGEALFQQAQALMSAQKFDDAIVVLEEHAGRYGTQKRRHDVAALSAIAHARRSDPAEALARIERVDRSVGKQLTPSLRASLLYEKAWCLRTLERDDLASGVYQTVLGISPPGRLQDRATLELAELEVEAGRFRPAADRLAVLRERIGRGAGTNSRLREHCLYQLGLCFFELGEPDESASLLETFLESYPRSKLVPAASLLAGEAMISLGRPHDAVGHLERVVEKYAGHQAYGPSLLRLGDAFATIQAWPRSLEAFQTYLTSVADPPLWYQATFGVGFAHENQDQHDEAIKAYRQVVDRHDGPTAARAQFQIGECHFAARRYEDAVRELLRVDILYAYPEWSAAALYEAGRCFEELGDSVNARKQFQRVQANHGSTDWARLANERLDRLKADVLPGHGE